MGRLISLSTLLSEKFDNHLSPGTLRNWCSSGRFPFVHVGARILFDEDEVDVWIDKCRNESANVRADRSARQANVRYERERCATRRAGSRSE